MAQESRLVIVVDSSQARPSTDSLTRAMLALDDAGVRVSGTTQNIGAQMQRMAGQSNAAAAALRRGLIATLGSLSTMKIIDIADEWGQYASRIRMATQSVEEYDTVQARMLASANQTYRNISETREAFIQMSPVIRQMGASLEQSMDVVDAFSGLLVINAANGERGAAAMRALSLAMQKGKMDAQNWMTIASSIPSLIDEIAAHTGKSADEIRKLGAEGKLSVQMLVDALGGRFDAIMQKVADMPTTVRDALNNVSNAFGEYIGRHNEANQVTATLAAGIEVLGNHLDTVLTVALAAGAGALGRYAVGMAAAGVQTAAKAVQTRRASAADLALAKAQEVQTRATLAQVSAMQGLSATHAQATAATLAHEKATQKLAAAKTAARGAGMGLLGVLGGPVGIAVTAGLAAAAFIEFGSAADKSRAAVEGLGQSLDAALAKFRQMGILQREQTLKALADAQQAQARQARNVAMSVVSALPVRSHGRFGVWEDMGTMARQLQERMQESGLSAHELQQALSDLVQEWVAQGKVAENVGDSYVDAALKMVQTQDTANQLGTRLAAVRAEQDRLAVSATTASAAQKAALVQTSEAAKSWMGRLQDRALLAGLNTQREQLDALVAAGKLVFSPKDLKRAREWADTVDRANASSETRQDGGAAYLQSLRERIALLGKTGEVEQTLARIRSGALDLGEHEQAVLQEAQKLELLQRELETERVLKDLREGQSTTQMQFMRELASFGQGESIRALNADLAKVEDQYRRLIEARRNSAHGLSEPELAQIQAALQEELDMVRWFHDEKRKIEQNGTLGAVNALREVADEAQNVYKQVENAVTNAFKGMEDALVEFVKTGKADFKSLADSIITDMIRIAIRKSVTGPLAGAVGGWLSGLFASGGYTGDGGRHEPTGIVHRGEGVLNQDEIRALGGESGFNALRRAIRGAGHATGGMAGRPARAPLPNPAGGKEPQVTIHIHNEAGAGNDTSEASAGLEVFGKIMQKVARDEYQKMQIRDYRDGGLHWQARQGALA